VTWLTALKANTPICSTSVGTSTAKAASSLAHSSAYSITETTSVGTATTKATSTHAQPASSSPTSRPEGSTGVSLSGGQERIELLNNIHVFDVLSCKIVVGTCHKLTTPHYSEYVTHEPGKPNTGEGKRVRWSSTTKNMLA
jgi:hypothetical protein